MKRVNFFILFWILISISVSGQTVNDCIDSIVSEGKGGVGWRFLYKLDYTHDSDCKIIQIVNSGGSGINDVRHLGNKINMIYDSSGNKISLTNYNWIDSTNSWLMKTKIDYTYDSIDNLVEAITFIFNDSFTKSEKTTNSYDINRNITKEIKYYWNKAAQIWDSNTMREKTYDSNGNLILSLYYEKDYSYTYLVLKEKAEYIKNNDGNVIQILSFDWKYKFQIWDTIGKILYTYDSSKNLSSRTDYNFINNRGYKRVYSYDSLNNNTGYLLFSWNVGKNKWDTISFDENIYNSNNKILKKLTYEPDYTTKKFELAELVSYYYSGSSSIEESKRSNIKIYPNPANDFIQFEIENNVNPFKFQLFDLYGRVMISQDLFENDKISVNHLKSGIYFYMVILDNKVQSGKLIIE